MKKIGVFCLTKTVAEVIDPSSIWFTFPCFVCRQNVSVEGHLLQAGTMVLEKIQVHIGNTYYACVCGKIYVSMVPIAYGKDNSSMPQYLMQKLI